MVTYMDISSKILYFRQKHDWNLNPKLSTYYTGSSISDSYKYRQNTGLWCFWLVARDDNCGRLSKMQEEKEFEIPFISF